MKKLIQASLFMLLGSAVISCNSSQKENTTNTTKNVSAADENPAPRYPSDIITNLDQWSILLGNGDRPKDLKNFQHPDYFYTTNDGVEWVVYKAPNVGITSPNSYNTRTELGQKHRWTPKEGGRLTGTLKVMHVSTKGDAQTGGSFSVVVGQIHSDDGHENEPLKIAYKKFPGHTKGSVYWNYEINTEGDNSGRWDFSTAVWGYDMSVRGDAPDAYPPELEDGIELGEEFSYEVNVYDGVMYLTFTSEGHETKTFTKNLIKSDFVNKEDMPQQVVDHYVPRGRDGTEKPNAYEGETQFFKQGAYNQTNGRNAPTSLEGSTEAETTDGKIAQQYTNGSYTEVWFKESSIGPGIPSVQE